MKKTVFIGSIITIALIAIVYFTLDTMSSIPFEKLSSQDIGDDIRKESDYLYYISGYNYWKTADGFIFMISNGPTDGAGAINVKSVKKDANGTVRVVIKFKNSISNINSPQIMTYSIVYMRVKTTDENFVVMAQDGRTFTRIPKNEFHITGTIVEGSLENDGKYNPTFINIEPDSIENNPLYRYATGLHDFVQLSFTPASSKQGKLLKKGDRVEIIYFIDRGTGSIVSIKKLD